MAQDFPADDGDPDAFSDAVVARIVLELDEAITRKRRATAARFSTKLRAALATQPRLPIRPTRMELAVFTALAQTYGRALLDQADFAPVLDGLAAWGAVVVVQRALWGERPDDVRLAARLLAARVPFEILCGTWPEVFMAQAHAELQGFRPRPPAPPTIADEARGDD